MKLRAEKSLGLSPERSIERVRRFWASEPGKVER